MCKYASSLHIANEVFTYQTFCMSLKSRIVLQVAKKLHRFTVPLVFPYVYSTQLYPRIF